MMTTAELFVRALENEGVQFVFGVPGEETLDLLEALRQSSQIRFIGTRHEQAAGFMAATIGRLTGKTGVALSTLGPGATNFVTAAAYATLSGMPMLMITGQKPIKSRKQGGFQVVHVQDIMRPVTKNTEQVTSGSRVPSLVRSAFRTAEQEMPGAVHIELPEDIAKESVEGAPLPVTRVRRPAAEEKAIVQAIAMIEQARRPLLMVGASANRTMTSKMLTRFVEKTGIPFFCTQMGKGVIDESHAQYIGTAAVSSNDLLHKVIGQADCIINVGHDTIEKPPFLMGREGMRVLHINFFPAHIADIYFPDIEVVGDIANAIWQITEGIAPQTHWDFSVYAGFIREMHDSIAAAASDTRIPLIPERVVADIRAVMGKGDIVTLDNGMYKIWFARNYTTYLPNTLLLDNALATMGAGLPSAIAAKLVHPQKNVLAVVGDGGFLMSAQEVETAVRLQLDLVVLLVNDGGYGMVEWKQRGEGLPAFGLRFGNPDFVKFAKSFGATGHRVTAAEELAPILEKAFAAGGVHLIDVPVDYSESHRFFGAK